MSPPLLRILNSFGTFFDYCSTIHTTISKQMIVVRNYSAVIISFTFLPTSWILFTNRFNRNYKVEELDMKGHTLRSKSAKLYSYWTQNTANTKVYVLIVLAPISILYSSRTGRYIRRVLLIISLMIFSNSESATSGFLLRSE